MRPTTHLPLLLLFVGLAASPALADVMVHVGHNRVDPANVNVGTGTTVVFHNLDEMPGGHTIIADDGSFQSPPLAKDQQWSHTFSMPGRFGYSIKEHPAAKGTVTVGWE